MAKTAALALALVLFGAAPPLPAAEAPAKTPAPAPAPAKATAAAPAAPADPAAAESYETLGQGAVRTQDVATLLSSFVERCTGEKRELDRARCRATTAYLRRSLPKRTFAFVTDDPAVVAVSDYDAASRATTSRSRAASPARKPIAVGRSGEPRLVTVKVPDKDAESLTKAVSLSRNTFGFDSLAEAKQWLDSRAPVPARRVPVPARRRQHRVDVRRQERRRAEAARRARLQPLHRRRAGVEAAVDGHRRPPGARATKTRPAPARSPGWRRSSSAAPDATTTCRRS